MLKKMLKIRNRVMLAGAGLLASNVASSAAIDQATDDFFAFYDAINGWATSGLGVGLSITSLVVGAAMGIGKSSPMLALGGVILAAIISWGPNLILQLVTGGATI